MKTTLDIHDELFKRAKRNAREAERSLRAVVEDDIRRVVEAEAPRRYKLPDLRAGDSDARSAGNILLAELRELIHYGSGER